MEVNDNRLKCADVKKWDLVDYLAKLGFYPDPKKSRGNVYLYNSPLNPPDITPSFKVDRKRNTWFDHSIGKGGDLIKFAILFDNCTIGEFLFNINGDYFNKPRPSVHSINNEIPESNIHILRIAPISSYGLLKYLKERRIDMEVAHTYCHEVNYKIYDKNYYGVGFKNDSGGWELRNPWMKSASYPKDITSIDQGSSNVHAFEGFFNFLTFATIYKDLPVMQDNFCVLNGLGMFEKARTFMELHDVKNLYLDNSQKLGKGGNKFTADALALNLNYQDQRALYKGYGDLNEWHVSFGKPLRPVGHRL